ncbi:MAG: MG2 domain-containing protein [Bryobacteraceae bacterium]
MEARYVTVALLALASAAIIGTFYRTRAADSDAPTATYSQGALHVEIPYTAPRAGAGILTIEVVNPEDAVLGRSEHRVTLAEGKGSWRQDLKLDKPLTTEELVWHRLRYRFLYSGDTHAVLEGTDSISQILRMPVVHVMAQQLYLSGAAAAVRVVATDSKNEPIAGASSVRIELVKSGAPNSGVHNQALFTGPLNQRGTTEAQLRFPAGLVGGYSLRYVVDTPIGSTEFTQPVRLEDKVSILLTTEKPIYQPGQTIHVRALALDRANHQAAGARNLTFEVEDSRGNKVFKKSVQTDAYGIASAEFALASEVNLGTYHLRALMDGGTPGGGAQRGGTPVGGTPAGGTPAGGRMDGAAASRNTAEIALSVERYVLPKFKVAVDFAGKDEKTRHGYRPGDHVTGTVRANYFFGKAVDNAEVTVKASGMDVAVVEVASAEGKTDGEGAYRFDLKLPNYFAGRPLSQGAARVLVEAMVKDATSHSESRGEPITVSESPLLITAVPEGGTLIPGIENQVFVLTSYADGKPAKAELRVRAAGNPEQNVNTDESGVALIPLAAASAPRTLEVEARDQEGNRTSSSVPLQLRQGAEQILLRTEHAVYNAGDRIQLRVFSTRPQGAVYVDAVKDGQTVLTRDLDMKNGQAELDLTATPELAGTVDFNAYLFGRDARPVSDHRLVFVQPAGELKIEATADRAVYKPGDDARIQFRVTNERGEGVQAALGLQVVDEAVFALAEKQPGFAKVFFYLEQEAMKPRYEIHSLSMPEVVGPVRPVHPVGGVPRPNQAARALFAATEMVNTNQFDREFGRTVPQTHYNEYANRYRTQFQAQVQRIAESFNHANEQHREQDLTELAGRLASAGAPELRDAWDNGLHIERMGGMYMVRSAGPDKQFNTGDDLTGYLRVSTRPVVRSVNPSGNSIDLRVEHDQGPFNGLAQIAGGVLDNSGAGVPNANIVAREISSAKTRSMQSGAAGQFQFAGLPAGEYDVQISLAGFKTTSRRFTIAERDRAVLTVTLNVGAMTETVFVSAGGVGQGMGGGFGGGAFRVGGAVPAGMAGGVIGGIVPAPMGALAAPRQMAQMGRNLVIDGALAEDAKKVPFAADFNGALAVTTGSITGLAPAPRVRSYFPEALYINPEIITGGDGRATIAIPLADSITTWRMAMMASTMHGALGSGTSSVKVFQDFFTDLDLPVTLTQGDRVSIPVAVYNYSGGRGDVSLKLQKDDWFSLVQDTPEKNLTVEAGRVGSSGYTIEANRIGTFKLTLAARMAGTAGAPAGVPSGPGGAPSGPRADIVVREIEVIPNGREQTQVFNGRLESAVHQTLTFPPASIPDASAVLVRLYPGPLSQVIEGMDAILRMPGGCFEQTSSATYPNVLALDYMKRTGKLTPEVHAKAEGFIANGYQRLLTFEVPGGGFSWFGQAPANKILTAYGLMEFGDMAKVSDVDPKLIQRTQQWLASEQQGDGSWKPDTNFINEGATNRYNSDVLRITAYIAWSLENTGYQGPAVEKARQFVGQHMSGAPSGPTDAYTLAVLANFAADYGKDREFTGRAMQNLLDARTEKDEQAWWTAEETGMYGAGQSAAVETTGLAVQALLKWGQASPTAAKALAYLASKKTAAGTWGTTQATIMALRALLLATGKGAADVRGTVEITLNGKPVEKLVLTPENNDLLHQFVFKGVDATVNGKAANDVAIRFDGKGGLAYQVVGRYFLPWAEKPAADALSIDVAYDRTRLAQDDIATATATVKNNLPKSANMVMVDLGIPPGFDLLTEDLQTYQEQSAGRKSGRLEKFNLTATQAILYFDAIGAGDTVKLSFRLRAKYPIRARTFQSRVYEYYDPDVNSVARPVQLEVAKK